LRNDDDSHNNSAELRFVVADYRRDEYRGTQWPQGNKRQLWRPERRRLRIVQRQMQQAAKPIDWRRAMTPKSCLVRDYMARTLIKFRPDMDVLDAVHELVAKQIAGAPVVDGEGNLIGMLSELDCLKVALNASYHGHWGGPVAEFMSKGAETVDAEMNIIDLAQVFLDSGYRRFPVVQDNRLVGQISRRDVLRALENIARG
jgi:CBS domain-containing protein